MRLNIWSALVLALLLSLTVSVRAADEKRARTDRYGDPLPPGALVRFGSTRLRLPVRELAFAFWPDDRTLAVCCEDGSLHRFERDTGRELPPLRTALSGVRAAAFLPHSKTLVLVDDARKMVLWDTEANKARWKVKLEDESYFGPRLLAAPDGKLLAVAVRSTQAGVHLYEIASGRKIRSLEGIGDYVCNIAFSPEGVLLAVAGRNKTAVGIWDVRTGKRLRELPGLVCSYGSNRLAFSHDGKRVAMNGADEILVADARTGKKQIRFSDSYAHLDGSLAFSADDRMLISGGFLPRIRFWDLRTGKERLHRDLTRRCQLLLSADGKVLALGCATTQGQSNIPLRLLDSATGKDLVPVEGHPRAVRRVAFSLDGRTLFSSCQITLRTWEVETGKPKQRLNHFSSDESLSQDRKLLADPRDRTIYLRDVATRKIVRDLTYTDKDSIVAVAFTPDGKSLLSLHNKCAPGQHLSIKPEGQDGLRVWDLATGKETRHILTDTSDLFEELIVTPDGRWAIAGTVSGRLHRECGFGSERHCKGAGPLYVWDLRQGRLVRRLNGHTGATLALALSADGRLLASASGDGTFRVWEMISGKTLFTLPGKPQFDQTLALSPDGLLLATNNGSPKASFAIDLWSTITGKRIGKLPGDGSSVTTLAFSPDGRRLASGMAIGTALVWDVTAFQRQAREERRRPGSKELTTLWADLASADAVRARQAVWHLVARGEQPVRLLDGRLKPRAAVETKRLQNLIAGLDADGFAEREAASKELEHLGELAEPALRAAQKGRLSPEMRRRIRAILTHLDRQELPAEQLRELRAVEVLERIGSKEARTLLARLAEGTSESRLTQEAKAALARLPAR